MVPRHERLATLSYDRDNLLAVWAMTASLHGKAKQLLQGQRQPQDRFWARAWISLSFLVGVSAQK